MPQNPGSASGGAPSAPGQTVSHSFGGLQQSYRIPSNIKVPKSLRGPLDAAAPVAAGPSTSVASAVPVPARGRASSRDLGLGGLGSGTPASSPVAAGGANSTSSSLNAHLQKISRGEVPQVNMSEIGDGLGKALGQMQDTWQKQVVSNPQVQEGVSKFMSAVNRGIEQAVGGNVAANNATTPATQSGVAGGPGGVGPGSGSGFALLGSSAPPLGSPSGVASSGGVGARRYASQQQSGGYAGGRSYAASAGAGGPGTYSLTGYAVSGGGYGGTTYGQSPGYGYGQQASYGGAPGTYSYSQGSGSYPGLYAGGSGPGGPSASPISSYAGSPNAPGPLRSSQGVVAPSAADSVFGAPPANGGPPSARRQNSGRPGSRRSARGLGGGGRPESWSSGGGIGAWLRKVFFDACLIPVSAAAERGSEMEFSQQHEQYPAPGGQGRGYSEEVILSGPHTQLLSDSLPAAEHRSSGKMRKPPTPAGALRQ